jgi:hypothetical protein
MNSEQSICHNCGESTSQHYCPNCGQRASVSRVTFRETFDDLADNLFSLQAPLPRTLKMMVVNPGKLFKEYLAGRRKSYYKPIPFFLLTTLVYISLRWMIGFNKLTVIGNPEDNPLIDAKLLDQAGNFMFQNINNLLFIFVMALAMVMKIFFYRCYSLIEFLAVSFYLIGFYSLLATINIFYIQFVDNGIQFLAILTMWVYFVYAMTSFFEGRKWITGFKAVVIYAIAFMLYVFLSFNLSYLIILLKQI